MIHTVVAANGQKFAFFLTLEEYRLHPTTPHLRYLFKFTNDMTSEIVYAYPLCNTTTLNTQGHMKQTDRYTRATFEWTSSTNDFLTLGLDAKVNLRPAGFWYYEVYGIEMGETWDTNLTPGCACCYLPKDELGNYCTALEVSSLGWSCTHDGCDETLRTDSIHLVEEGKLLVTEQKGSEEVEYIQQPQKKGNNTIYIKT